MKRTELVRLRRLLIAALLIFDGYLLEEVGTREEVGSAPLVVVTLLEVISESLQNKKGRA